MRLARGCWVGWNLIGFDSLNCIYLTFCILWMVKLLTSYFLLANLNDNRGAC